MTKVFKIVSERVWAEVSGPWAGTELDERDGFIHLSSEAQVPGTLARHFAGAKGLVLLELDAEALPDLRWEPSRDGALFPHLYAALDPAWVRAVHPIESPRS